jgi:hypothetical protein
MRKAMKIAFSYLSRITFRYHFPQVLAGKIFSDAESQSLVFVEEERSAGDKRLGRDQCSLSSVLRFVTYQDIAVEDVGEATLLIR